MKYKDVTIWNDCSLMWTKDSGLNKRTILNSQLKDSDILDMKDKYLRTHGECDDVWLDTKSGLTFTSAANYFNSPFEFSFLNSKKDFLYNPTNGLHFVKKNYSYLFNRGFQYNDELITDLPQKDIDKYKNKKLLLLAAGPTLKERVDEIDFSSYDFIWSCTKFFLNPKIKNIELDLFSIGGNVELDDSELEAYLTENKNTKYGLECFIQPFKLKEQLVNFRDKHGADRGFTFHTRYFSKLGAGPRLLVLAAMFQLSEVHLLGIDGHPLKFKHSFESSKKYVENEAATREDSEDAYRRQFCILWKYLLSFPRTTFVNLGQGHEGNQSTDVFA